jgi:heat-inducible transcriptional repressor
VPLSGRRLLLVLITGAGRVEQRSVDLPDAMADEDVAHLRAVLNASLDGKSIRDVPRIVGRLPETLAPAARPNAAAVFSTILESLIENNDGRVVFGGAANLAAADLSIGLREVLEALEEQVVLIRLLGEVAEPASVTVRIGAENPVEGLRGTSLVTTGYGGQDQALARLGVLGPTRMDYPGAMAAVRAVARYVSQILAGS